MDAIRSMPNFRKYLAGGSEFRGGMRTIYPSVTYPIHVSILTGCYAGKHQITSNFKFTTTQPRRQLDLVQRPHRGGGYLYRRQARGAEDGLRVVALSRAATRTSTT